MTNRTSTPAAVQNDRSPDRPTTREVCPPDHQIRQSEADREFEARLQWFLALSRAA